MQTHFKRSLLALGQLSSSSFSCNSPEMRRRAALLGLAALLGCLASARAYDFLKLSRCAQVRGGDRRPSGMSCDRGIPFRLLSSSLGRGGLCCQRQPIQMRRRC
jgi:hypothetical protein